MAEEKIGMGCYLTFDDASQGSLFIHWSETPIPGAWAFFSPGKEIPKFKFKQNGGRNELARQCGGVFKKNLHAAWCSYAKMCRECNGKLLLVNTDVGMFVNDNQGKVVRVQPGVWTGLSDQRAVSCASSTYAGYGSGVDGVGALNMTRETFMMNVGEEGFYIAF